LLKQHLAFVGIKVNSHRINDLGLPVFCRLANFAFRFVVIINGLWMRVPVPLAKRAERHRNIDTVWVQGGAISQGRPMAPRRLSIVT
jgi:hypothetical protein